ncbi:hypothetical protein G647_01819 [Cladophialophora carrionii CBS 160.54]|uniref:Uncharacterized protein n=1 Tax=Cladophialophora carrionii CBS 160.54 TaxID=1279043 RepID=V9DRW0_9EURO|nr:uncharacterized protein G647_01819 [Cladophialophora carrionii CBS 160.54]ETI29366.1 hypothetical protein G647_01819 [Cladophialophora carrionii CBS 160.54]
MAPLKPAERLNFFLQLQHPLRNALLDKYQDSRLQGFQILKDPKSALDQLMARILTFNNPTEVVFQMSPIALPFFFIDELSNTRILLNVNRDTPFGHLLAILREASADIATQIKNVHFPNDGTRDRPSAAHFTWDDGPYLSRIVTVTQGPGGQERVSRTEWKTVYARTYLELFNGPHARKIGSSVEIQHTLQHFRNLSAFRRGSPPPSGLRQVAETASNGIHFPAPGQGHHNFTYQHPAPHPQRVLSRLLPFVDEPSRTPIPPPLAPSSPPPSPPSPVAGRPVVRLPPVSTSVVAPLRVVPVSSTSRAGVLVVDGGDLAWYKREGELRGWLRFGSAEAVESVDVWSGW